MSQVTALRARRAFAALSPRGPTGTRSWRRVALAAVTLLLGAVALAQQPVPPLRAHVTDVTGTLSAESLAALEQKLVALEQRKGTQVAVLMVATVAPEAIEAYSLRVAEAWRIGRGKTDDGIVLVVAKNDRRMRIEVGYGLEGAVTDALARRIIAERLAPRFYEDDYAGGIDAGVDALIALIDGESLPTPEAASERRGVGFDGLGALPILLFVVAFAAPLLRRSFGTLGGSLLVGGGVGFVVWLISSVLLLSIFLAILAFVFALLGIRGGPGGWTSGGGPFIGGMGRGGGFGGGGGGGGFRGGGGRFGGGGASGGW